MSIPFHVTQQPQAFVRVSIAARGYRSDLVLPGSLPLVDIMPAISSRLLDQGPGAATQGAVLSASDGRILHGGQSLFSQGVKDGDILTLAPRAVETEKRYDDVVEAVADSVEEKNRPWTPANSATMAVAGAVALILTTLVILLRSQDQAPIIVPAVAGVMTLLLLGTVWALQRSGARGTRGRWGWWPPFPPSSPVSRSRLSPHACRSCSRDLRWRSWPRPCIRC